MLSGVTALKNDGTGITGSIASKTSSDLTASGATVTAPAGYYASSASKSVSSGTAGTPTATKGTVSSNSVSVTPSVTNTTGYITGGTINGTPVTVSASELVSGTKSITSAGTTNVTNYASASVASGSATTPATTITANPSISVSSGGLITASVSASKSVTPTVSAGYVSSGTAGTITVSGSNTSQLTAQAAQTIHPSTSDQTIASGKYLTGTQTVKGVLLTNLSAGNIKKDMVVKVGDSTDDDCVASVTGTYEGGGSSSWHKLVDEQENDVSTTSTTSTAAFTIALGSSAYNYSQIIWVHIRDKAGNRNGYFYGSDVFFINSNATRLGNVLFSSPGGCRITYTATSGYEATGSTGYGVYGYSIAGDGTLTVNCRYSSNYSKTINGTYVTNVYALDLPDNLTLFTNVLV